MTTAIPAGNIFVPLSIKVEYALIEDKLESGKRYSVLTNHGFTFSVEIMSETPGCNAELQMHAMNIFWGRKFEWINNTVNGAEIRCPR